MPFRSWVVSTIVEPVAVEVVEQVQHLVARAHVETGRRLVEEDHLARSVNSARARNTRCC